MTYVVCMDAIKFIQSLPRNEECSGVIVLKRREFLTLTAVHGWAEQKDIAKGLGLNPGTVSRTLSGRTSLGVKFIAAVLNYFAPYGLGFEDLFDVIAEDEASKEVAA